MPTPTPKSQLTARTHPYAAVLFADLVGFTAAASEMTPEALVTTLDVMFGHFDDACHGLGIEKIKTMGDCYMCCTMADQEDPQRRNTAAVVALATQMHGIVDAFKFGGRPMRLRAGVNTGCVTAGIIGKLKFSYDIWGDTVNVASRMESTGVVGATQVTAAVHAMLRDDLPFVARDPVVVKGKGILRTYLHWPERDRPPDGHPRVELLSQTHRCPTDRGPASPVTELLSSPTHYGGLPEGVRSMMGDPASPAPCPVACQTPRESPLTPGSPPAEFGYPSPRLEDRPTHVWSMAPCYHFPPTPDESRAAGRGLGFAPRTQFQVGPGH